MSYQQILEDLASTIFSQVSASGPTLCAKQDGPMTDQCGPEVARASLSARQAKEQGLLMSGTYGLPSSTSSSSAALQSSLESRLRAKLSNLGSTLYKLTWKPWVTPSGVCRSRLRASVLRTSETGLIGWPTPTKRDGRTLKGGQDRPSKKGGPSLIHLAGWCTPTATDRNRGVRPPRPQDTGIPLSQQAGMILSLSSVQMENTAQLNEEFVLWLTGLPIRFLQSAHSVTLSSPRRRKRS